MNTSSIPGNGKSPNEIQAFRLVWNDVTIFIKWEPNAFGGVIAHLEMMSDGQVPFPISDTGYRSHFCHKEDVELQGGPVAFVRAWLEQEGGAWQHKRKVQQPALFAV